MTRHTQVNHVRILVTLVHKIKKQEEYCLSLAWTLTSRNKSRTDDRIERTSNMVNKLEESTLNHYIVLQWRINKIASWMSLKSSETNHCSWSNSAVLESSFISSSCCQACFPSTVRPMNRLWELVLKIFFHSPEINRSIFFSMHCCEWRRRNVTFFDTSLSEKEYFPGSMSIQFLLPMGTIFGKEPASSLLCGFPFAFEHAKSFAFSFNAYSSCWSYAISVSLLFKFITNLFDPWEILTQEWVLSLSKDQILISTPYLPCISLAATSYTGPILVFPWIHPFGCDAPSSLGRVYSRQATTWNCVRSAVSFVMMYCPFQTTLRNPASIQNLLKLSCCDSFSIRCPHCCRRKFSFAGSSQSKGTSVLITEHEWGTWVSHHNGSPRSLLKGFMLFTYLCDCSEKTELGCRDNYAKNSLNRFQIGCIVYRQFSMSFAVELTSGQWGRCTENWTSAFGKFHQHPFCNFVPDPCGLSSLIECTFSQNQDQ